MKATWKLQKYSNISTDQFGQYGGELEKPVLKLRTKSSENEDTNLSDQNDFLH